ncbi:hypothetical protein FSP39_015403 [Pinctada imbricata]|uniref:Temptin Cys/Cys disulfide domain-containing protein n=1 Tax=Pinctada imbricata TaxID=66713 RepID=A0AA88YAK2_PINIB|nr:hypothetical protein FSP39_015403 [Pinctada imbricata]
MERIIVVALCLIGTSFSYKSFQSAFPNGKSVPNPCLTPAVWDAVGHYNPSRHTIFKNPFARDFLLNNFKWTPALCLMDSDNDGRTNGEELGDPSCVWSVGRTPEFPASGHPGICEPIGSSQCRSQHFACDCLENCPGLENAIPSGPHRGNH